MLGNDRFNFRFRDKSPLPRGLETAIDALELLRRRLICAAPDASVDFERDLGELLLRHFGPSLGSPQRLFECF